MSNIFPTVKLVQKDYTRKDGKRNTFIRLTINRRVKYFALNVFVRTDHLKKRKVSKLDPDFKDKQSLLNYYFIKAEKILLDFRLQDKHLGFEVFDQNFNNTFYGSDSFYDFYEQTVEKFKTHKTHSNNTIKAYNSQLIKLKEFRSKVTFRDIDMAFINSYVSFIKNQKGNNQNTITKSVTYILSILNKAVEQGVINENPIKRYKKKQIRGNREFLTMREVNRLERVYYEKALKPNILNVIRYFLFSCYTGLRYQDVKVIRFRDIQNSNYISVQMTKTKEFVSIPLIQKAKDLIGKGYFENQAIFKVMSNQPTNRYLKEIMQDVGINKTITFHCARHTFATLSKSMGIEYDVISKILGHTDIKTTKIYTKYELSHLEDEMKKWE